MCIFCLPAEAYQDIPVAKAGLSAETQCRRMSSGYPLFFGGCSIGYMIFFKK